MKRWIVAALLAPFSVGTALATVNVNTAQQSELQRTKGLDRYKAKAIIEHRARYGPFTSIEELEEVSGLDKAALEKAGPELAVSGPPYTPPPKRTKSKK